MIPRMGYRRVPVRTSPPASPSCTTPNPPRWVPPPSAWLPASSRPWDLSTPAIIRPAQAPSFTPKASSTNVCGRRLFHMGPLSPSHHHGKKRTAKKHHDHGNDPVDGFTQNAPPRELWISRTQPPTVHQEIRPDDEERVNT